MRTSISKKFLMREILIGHTGRFSEMKAPVGKPQVKPLAIIKDAGML
jgi:hypothetical protein